MSEGLLSVLLDEGRKYLYRGVPENSPEVASVRNISEVEPRNPQNRGDHWLQMHMAGMTDTAYTSWTSERSMAEEVAFSVVDEENLDCGIRIFRVEIDSLSEDQVFAGRADESEYLIEGTIEDVTLSEEEEEDD